MQGWTGQCFRAQSTEGLTSDTRLDTAVIIGWQNQKKATRNGPNVPPGPILAHMAQKTHEEACAAPNSSATALEITVPKCPLFLFLIQQNLLKRLRWKNLRPDVPDSRYREDRTRKLALEGWG